MTNRRPDIHCTGCEVYCYSLSYLPSEQKFPTSHYCDECKKAIDRNVRSESMLNYAWYKMFHNVSRQFQQTHQLSQTDINKIGSFGWTMRYREAPEERPFDGDPNKMTMGEWREIAKKKLTYYKQYCSKRELTLLRLLILTAH